MGGCDGDPQTSSSTGAPAATSRLHGGARHVAARADREAAGRPASRNGSAPSIRCSSSTPPARPASPRACSTRTGGYLLWAALTMKWTFDIKPTDVFWCTADIGWVTGHTYITYGPLALRRDRGRVRRHPDLPERRPLLEDDRRSTRSAIFYTAPTAIRSLIKAADGDADGAPDELRPVEPAHPRHGRRADQSGSVDVVPQERRRRAAARSSTPGGRPRPAAT